MANNVTSSVKSEADSNLIATLKWEIPKDYFRAILRTHNLKTEIQLKGFVGWKEISWLLYLINDGFIRLILNCMTPTEYSFPTIYYDIKFGGTAVKPYMWSKGPVFSTNIGPLFYFSYGAKDTLTIPIMVISNDLRNFVPGDNLIITLKLYTRTGITQAPDLREIKVYSNPSNEALVNDLTNLLKEPKYSDVTIICAGESLKAHKCILAARSSVFSQMFESIINEITIIDVDISVMKLVLQFIYTGEADLSKSNLEEVMKCAEKYDLAELKALCYKHMCERVGN